MSTKAFSSRALMTRCAVRRLIAACKGEEVFTRAQSYGISWGLVRAPEENYDVAHYQQRDFWRDVEHPEIGRAIRYPRGPFMCDALGIATVAVARKLGVDPESALRRTIAGFAERYERFVVLAAERGVDVETASEDDLRALFREAR